MHFPIFVLQDNNGNGGGCGEASCRRCLLGKLRNSGLSLDLGNGGKNGGGEQCSGARYIFNGQKGGP